MSELNFKTFDSTFETHDLVEAACLTAVGNAMPIVREGQVDNLFLGEHDRGEVKADGTLVTTHDVSSEAMLLHVLSEMLPDASAHSEEGGFITGGSNFRIGLDPLDGTRPKNTSMPNSTIIATAYREDEVYGAVIAEPISGRVFSAFGEGNSVVAREFATTGKKLSVARFATINGLRAANYYFDKRGDKAQLFIDNNLPFVADGKEAPTFTAKQHPALRWLLAQAEVGVLEAGSNGAHQLYLFQGERAAGAITTARGIPEDTSAGAFLVERAGGSVQRLYAENGELEPCEQENPDYNALVVASNPSNLNFLMGLLDKLNNSREILRQASEHA
jgi:fructose-1,6-bisphosphatase/inositol monophosphatase family enzyme